MGERPAWARIRPMNRQVKSDRHDKVDGKKRVENIRKFTMPAWFRFWMFSDILVPMGAAL